MRATFAALLLSAALVACGADGGLPTEQKTEAVPDDEIATGDVERLAESADPRTLYVVGNQYAIGDGVEQDQDIAERLWRVACDKGHAHACSNYGSRQIAHGHFDEAEKYLKTAAEAGVVTAIRNLIELYANPTWTGADKDLSARWRGVLQALDNPEPLQSPLAPEPGAEGR